MAVVRWVVFARLNRDCSTLVFNDLIRLFGYYEKEP